MPIMWGRLCHPAMRTLSPHSCHQLLPRPRAKPCDAYIITLLTHSSHTEKPRAPDYVHLAFLSASKGHPSVGPPCFFIMTCMVYVVSFLAICGALEPCTSFPGSEKLGGSPSSHESSDPCVPQSSLPANRISPPSCRPFKGMGTARVWVLSASTKSLNVQGCPFPSAHSAALQCLYPGPLGLTAHKAPLSAVHKATSGLRFALQMPTLKVCDTGQGQGRGVSQCVLRDGERAFERQCVL